MSKFDGFARYPARSLVGAETTLLTAWASLDRFHRDLVLVGGLAVKYLTKPGAGNLPGAVTMDVDLGVTLAAEGGQYGSLADDLAGQGFQRSSQDRFVRQFENLSIYLDFLTDHPAAISGTASVDGISAGIFPGVARALATRRMVRIEGADLFGAPQKFDVPVSGVGALLVLKLNAFAGRQQPKDAYDVLIAVSRSVDGSESAVASFHAEADAGNRGFPRAMETLRRCFLDPDQSGPLRAAAFVSDGRAPTADVEAGRRRILEQTVTVGRALAGIS